MLEVAEREELQHSHDAATQFGDQEVRPVGAINLAKRVDIIVDVVRVVGAWAESPTEQDINKVFNITVERVSDIELHGSRFLQI